MRYQSFSLAIIAAISFIAIPGYSQRVVLTADSTACLLPPKPTLTGTAYLEPYYAYDFNNPVPNNIPYLYNYNRHNEFNLNLALVSATYTDSNARGTIGLQTGTFPIANEASEPTVLQFIYQASAGLRILPNFWIDAGVFPSHFGIETAIGKDQWTLTRSLVAENSPYYETGVHPSYTRGDWNFGIFILNGWQNIQDVNSKKAFGTQIQYNSGTLTLNSSTFLGDTKPDSTPRTRIFHDFYAIVAISPLISVSGVYDIGWEQTSLNGPYAQWQGIDLIFRFRLSENFAVALRGEYYSDPDQIIVATGTQNGYQIAGYSANFDYIVSTHAVLRFEAKHYASKDAIFAQNNTSVTGSTILTSSLAISF